MATILKLLIMGLPASGKTTFVKHIFEDKDFEEFEEYRPTFGVGISLYEFKGSKGVMVSTFDCGGQTSFIDTYLTDQWVPTLFGKASAFFYLVDSSNKANLDAASKLFRKYYENLRRNSQNAKAYVLASKWDKHVITVDELKPFFKDMEIYPVSVLDGSARKVFGKLMTDLVQEGTLEAL
jgi:Ras-related GTP-binding protein A/B